MLWDMFFAYPLKEVYKDSYLAYCLECLLPFLVALFLGIVAFAYTKNTIVFYSFLPAFLVILVAFSSIIYERYHSVLVYIKNHPNYVVYHTVSSSMLVHASVFTDFLYRDFRVRSVRLVEKEILTEVYRQEHVDYDTVFSFRILKNFDKINRKPFRCKVYEDRAKTVRFYITHIDSDEASRIHMDVILTERGKILNNLE